MKSYFVKKFANQSSFMIDDFEDVQENQKKNIEPNSRLYGILGATKLQTHDENQSFVEKKFELNASFDKYKVTKLLIPEKERIKYQK